jgi:hypothetical protein
VESVKNFYLGRWTGFPRNSRRRPRRDGPSSGLGPMQASLTFPARKAWMGLGQMASSMNTPVTTSAIT